MLRRILAAAALLACFQAQAAITTYEFDTVTGFELERDSINVTGVLLNASTPTTVTIPESTSADYRYPVNRCVPVLLTMLEKPGRYVLKLIVEDPANVGLVNCALRLK